MKRGRMIGLLLVPAVLLLGGCMDRSERLFQRAEMFFTQGQPELAAQEYHRLAVKYPRSSLAPNALYKLAYLQREEFDSPPKALQTYVFLADHFPGSAYADEALLWVLQIQAEGKDTAGMKRTRDLIRERYPDDLRVCANAQLQVVRALYAAEQLPAAEAEARALLSAYPQQHRQCAAAMLIVARAVEKRGGKQSDEAVRAYEQIVNKYPDTPSAAEAKRAIGWIHYGKMGEQAKAEHQAKVRAARVISGVPSPPGVSHARLKPFACLSSLLAERGVKASPEDLLVVSGAAFDFSFDAQRPQGTWLRLPRNALMLAAEQYGFSLNSWSAGAGEASFAGLMGAISAGHPVAVPRAGSTNWWIVTGYKPAEDRVYVLESQQRAARAISRSQFISGWAASAGGHVSVVSGPHFQFSLGSRAAAPDAATMIRATARHAAENRAKVTASYESLMGLLSGQSDPPAEALRTWARQTLTQALAERSAAVRFLSDAVAQSPDARASLEQAVQEYREFLRLGQQLQAVLTALTAPAQGAEPPPEQTWPEAAEIAGQMQQAEERALQHLSALAR